MQNRKGKVQILLVAGVSLLLAVVLSIGVIMPGVASAVFAPVAVVSARVSQAITGAANQVAFFTSATNVTSDSNLYWDNTNKRLGIGTTTPARRLHVFGNIALFERASDSAGFIIQRTDDNRWVFGANNADIPANGLGFVISTYPLSDQQSSIPSKARLIITPEGKVGINTVTPDTSSKLNVVLTDNVTADGLAIYGTTNGGKTTGVAGTNDGLQSLGMVGGSYNQLGTNYGVGAYGTNILYGTSGSLGTPNEGVYGFADNTTGRYAGYFQGNVNVDGIITATGAKEFKITDPLDPNKYLIHASVEAPYMMNIYNGSVVLGSDGEAVVQLPAYFEALNKDFQYQLTCIGSPALVYVKEEIAGNSFTIAGDKPGVKVSWQVTGIRHDTWAEANPLQVEVDKSNDTSPARQSAAGSSGKKGWADWSKPPAMSK